MRDIILTLIIVALLPMVLRRPHVGILLWVWLSVMNPHRLTYGFAYSIPWAAIAAAFTFLALLASREPKSLPKTAPVFLLVAFAAWTAVTTATAFLPEASLVMLEKVAKVILMTLVAIMVVRTKEQLHMFIYTLAGSLAFYGVKGGLFTIRSGGSERVWGPAGSFIEGNNEVALAFITIIPVLYYIAQRMDKKWLRWGIFGAILLSGLASLGSYSRGALIGMAAMVLVLWWRSTRKVGMGIVMVLLIPLALNFMPEKWAARMDTIQTYEQDGSAMGRINAWEMAYNLALDHPLTGGGFVIYNAPTFARYAPDPTDIHAAHSIYFQVLGEHGFVGLALFLALAVTAWRRASSIRRIARTEPELKWASDMASMIQVGLAGFSVGGAFLSLAYFDVPYYMIAALIILGRIVDETVRAKGVAKRVLPDVAPKPVRPQLRQNY